MSVSGSSSLTRTALRSVLVALLVLGLKALAYLTTGSVALYSDALESIINVVAALGAYFALRLSARPADAGHPYGHSKAEYFSAVTEGVLIVLAAVSIIWAALPVFRAPRAVEAPLLGLLISGGASVINLVWARMLLHIGRERRSPALTADGKHVMSDVVTSVGVLGGVVLAKLTGWFILDPLLALLVAVNILWSGYGLVRDSVGGLMDAAVDPATERLIRQVMSEHADGALEAHDLRTRHAGAVTFIEFHLVVPGAMSVQEAHDICDRLEDAIRAVVDGASVTIHVEPQDKAKHHGVLVL